MKSVELPISPNYVCNWGLKEAIREILQNAIDGEKCGNLKAIEYVEDDILRISNKGIKLPMSSLVLGCSGKADVEGMIGKFGEGYKLALVVLLRKCYSVNIINADEIWKPSFCTSKEFGTQVLKINMRKNRDTTCKDLTFEIKGVNKDVYNDLIKYFPCIDNDYGKCVDCDTGQILLDPKFKGKMYVEGLYIQTDNTFSYGYNFNSDVVDLDRDRKAINYHELKKLTATSVISAENCEPELFKAISDSYTDIKDIIDVIDDANDEFLEQYRDMLYNKRGLDDNTLVATESVMRQLEQMQVDAPIVKGSEIESYLVAKANDKLGLLYDAIDKADNADDTDYVWSNVYQSNWFKIMCWLELNKKKLSESAISDLLKILDGMKPYHFDYISKYFPKDFVWNIDNYRDMENLYRVN